MKQFLLITSIFFLHTLVASASDVSIIAPAIVNSSKPFSVLVNLDTGGTTINSMDITLSYPKDILLFKGYKEDSSIKKIWLVQPKEEDGSIHFSGIIPGGVDGLYDPDKSGIQPIPLIELLFSPNRSGQGDFVITHSDILKNDGIGTLLTHDIKNANISVSISPDLQIETDNNNFTDIDPPEPFSIDFIPAGFFSKTPSMISFFATDLGSGVEKYQIKTASNGWKTITSPIATVKGILKREVVIRAVDFNSNSRESSVEIPGILSPLQLLGICIFCLTCYFTFFVVKRKR